MAHAKRAEESLIRRRANVHGGSACIGNHRIPVWVLEILRRLGQADTDILEGYPDVAREELAAAWRCADAHQAEMDWEIQRNEQD